MEKAKFLWSKTNRWHRGFLIFFIVELHILPGGKVGFTCNDPALSHTFSGDTITPKQLFGTIILLPLAVLLLVERTYHSSKGDKAKRRALFWFKEYMFGLLLNLIVVETLKLVVGAPRPHFFDTCSPKEAATCEGSEFVPRYTCTKVHWLTQSDTSFPSGHTSLAVHAGLFLIYYLHRRAGRSRSVLSSQLVILLAALYCGLSRMLDHRHHWWDVMAGAVLGLPILVYTIIHLCNNFEPRADKTPENINKEINNISIVTTNVNETNQ